MGVINIEDLSMTYEYYKKDSGLKGSLKNFIKKDKLYKEALKGINLNIDEGSIVGYVGLNGAGKTTTLKILSGIIKPTSGRVQVLGYDPYDKNYEFLKQIALVMGNKSQLWWDIPAIDSIELNRDIFEVNKEKYNSTLNELVDILNVKHLLNIQVRRLSLGERMKMELIAALIHSPKVIFLDEPTIGLDIISQNNIREFLKHYNKINNSTIILTSHNFDDIVHLCDRLLFINEGEIFYEGQLKKFLEEYSYRKVLTTKCVNNISEIISFLKSQNVNAFKVENDEVKIEIENDLSLRIIQQLIERYIKDIKDISIESLDIKEIIKSVLYDKNKKG